MAVLKVGILNAPTIDVTLHGDYVNPTTGQIVTGDITLTPESVGMVLEPTTQGCVFEVKDVIIGVNFHWERRENQKFLGALTVVEENQGVTVVNIIDVEDYLKSVISSEMSATASLELLKAHAVISRSWVMAQILPKKDHGFQSSLLSHTETIRWYDHVDHTQYDVCADDHCQRYQGITRQTTPNVEKAVEMTAGLVLDYEGELCDARFSKCCGGVFEEFQNCWEPVKKPYLVARADTTTPLVFPDLTQEEEAQKWIYASPQAFCNTKDPEILSQVLNNYDQETTHFYRWEVRYKADYLRDLLKRRTGIDFGHIRDIQPLERGTSGRIVKMRIVGTKHKRVIGKELEIRKSLSESHLYSSAFTVERVDIDTQTGIPQEIVLHGAGWGHGVGLCQIGAAVMAHKGYKYEDILRHYFPGSKLSPLQKFLAKDN